MEREAVAKAFGDIPVQMCHFHQVAIIKRYLTSRPKLEVSIELLKLCRLIPISTQTRFTGALSQWHDKHIKKLIKLHQGLSKKGKVKLIDEFLDQYNTKR
jgi:hypothetical protein